MLVRCTGQYMSKDKYGERDDSYQPPEMVAGETNKGTMSISTLITECNDAVAKLSINHPHKRLIFNCAVAMRQLVDRLAFYEDKESSEVN